MALVERWGSDALRITILFAGPFEDDIDWQLIEPDPNRRPAANAWLGRVYAAVWEAAERKGEEPEELRRLTHRTIEAVTSDLERFRFNVAISKLQVLTNELRSTLDSGGAGREAATALVQMLAPMAPFVTEELWREALGNAESVHVSRWPDFDEALAKRDRVVLVVQVDGKVRDRIEVDAGASEDEVRDLALGSDKVKRVVDGREIRQVIVRAPRLVNLVTAG
jgi:leucyl-tRNA synthetase